MTIELSYFIESLCHCLLGLDHDGINTNLSQSVLGALDKCWGMAHGPNKLGLASQCCAVASRSIDLPGLLRLSSEHCSQGSGVYHAPISVHYAWMLVPYTLIRTCFHMLLTGSKVDPVHKSVLKDLLPDILNHLFLRSAYCEVRVRDLTQALLYVDLWLDGNLLPSCNTRSLHSVEIFSRVEPRFENTLKDLVITCLRRRHCFRAWLHPDIMALLTDHVDEPHQTDPCFRTRQLLNGALSSATAKDDDSAQNLRLVYDALSCELCRRIEISWMAGKQRGRSGKTAVQRYLTSILACLAECVADGHYGLAAIAIEIAMLLTICISCSDDFTIRIDYYNSKMCRGCIADSRMRLAHGEVASYIRGFYGSLSSIEFPRTLGALYNSPLAVLRLEGLDPGQVLLIVTKEMRWHGLAIAEAQALMSCAEWTAQSDAPWTDELLYHLSTMQSDAEDRAIKHIGGASEGYVYDDVIDAWIGPIAPRTPDVQSVSHEIHGISAAPCVRKRPIGSAQDDTAEAMTVPRHEAVAASQYPLPLAAPLHETNATVQRINSRNATYTDEDEIDFLQHDSPRTCRRTRQKVRRFDVAEEAIKSRKLSDTRARNDAVRVFATL